jgi:acyl-CoA thioester hydrolase
MGRIKLEFPGRPIFNCYLDVRISDINYGGHVGNDSVLSLVHEARMQFLAEHNQSELDVFGSGLIMTDATISFLAEMFYGDRISVEIGVGEIGSSSFELFYKLSNGSKCTSIARTGFVCFDYELRKVKRVPAELLSLLEKGSS